MENRKRFFDDQISMSRTKVKLQEVCTEFEISGISTKISVRRHKDYKSIFTIEYKKRVIKEGSIRSVDLHHCLFEIVRLNKYLQYCNPVMAWSTYEFDKAYVDIRLHPSLEGAWEVRIRYKSSNTEENLHFPANMSQGDIMNSFISQLGIPPRK